MLADSDLGQLGTNEGPELSPQAVAQSNGIEDGHDGVANRRRLAKPPCGRRHAMDGDVRMVGNGARKRRAFVTDEIDVDAARG